ncbi:nuclear transport factor 2 family protein [Actinoallomurus sp. NPDC052274]|uniref:nuclear transport factor 2 family protein n=1 Tax=Actinoallomurus sp. NPDC052274 TaxID=3155420 RepID=UPI003414FEC2
MKDPLEVLERRRRLLVAGDLAEFADLFAEDAVLEMPFAVDGFPARLEGRETIREFSARADRMPVEITDLRTVQIHRTSDPEVVIIELVTAARLTTTGETFEVPCIQVFRIRDGRIVLFRDYVGANSLPDLTST